MSCDFLFCVKSHRLVRLYSGNGFLVNLIDFQYIKKLTLKPTL